MDVLRKRLRSMPRVGGCYRRWSRAQAQGAAEAYGRANSRTYTLVRCGFAGLASPIKREVERCSASASAHTSPVPLQDAVDHRQAHAGPFKLVHSHAAVERRQLIVSLSHAEARAVVTNIKHLRASPVLAAGFNHRRVAGARVLSPHSRANCREPASSAPGRSGLNPVLPRCHSTARPFSSVQAPTTSSTSSSKSTCCRIVACRPRRTTCRRSSMSFPMRAAALGSALTSDCDEI